MVRVSFGLGLGLGSFLRARVRLKLTVMVGVREVGSPHSLSYTPEPLRLLSFGKSFKRFTFFSQISLLIMVT